MFELAIGSGLARPRTLRCGNGDIEEERRRRSRRNKPILKSRGLNRRRERNYIYV